MRRLLNEHCHPVLASIAFESDPHTMAFYLIGDGYCRTVLASNGAMQIFAGGDQLLIKWVEIEFLPHIMEVWVKDFMWKSIILCYDIPRAIIIDNGQQFSGTKFCGFAKSMAFSSNSLWWCISKPTAK